MAADLLRTPPLTEQLADHLTEVAVGVDPASVMPIATCGGAAMRLEGLISRFGACVTAHLP